MFKAQRKQVLQRSVFQPFAVNILDAWKNEKGTCSVEYETDSISPSHISHWLEYRGDFGKRCPNYEAVTKGAGVVRLLLCETPHWHPLTFCMSRDQFLTVETAFDLPTATLPLFESHGSLHTWSINEDRFYFVMKVQQQNPIANYGLSFCHDLKSRTTTGILYGLNLTCQQEWYGTGFSGDSRIDELLPQLKELGTLLDHPLLLPILLLGCDIRRTQQFCMNEIEPRLLQVEEVLRVTRPGQITARIEALLHEKGGEDSDYTPLPFDEDRPYYQKKPKMIKLMTEINTLTTENLIALSVPSWQIRFAGFLKSFFDECSQMSTFQDMYSRSREMEDMLNHFASAAANNMEHMQQLRSRMELQLQVLYQFMTQADNHLHATLAAAATRDSSAMKTLAFLTALFLPGTYVATLFSMDMFSWSLPGEQSRENDTTVSSSFWIYWTITGILTFAVIGGWRLWWKKENSRYKEQYKSFLGLLDKKCDDRPGKDDCTTNGYLAAHEESEDDDDGGGDGHGQAKLRGGGGDGPRSWVALAGQALGLDNIGLQSTKSTTDAGTEAGPSNNESDLAVDVEAGLERPDHMDIDGEPVYEPDQQPELQSQHLVAPKNRHRYSQNLATSHHHPYILNRQPGRPGTFRAVPCSDPVFEDASSSAEVPAVPQPPRSVPDEDPWTRRVDVPSCGPETPKAPGTEESRALAALRPEAKRINRSRGALSSLPPLSTLSLPEPAPADFQQRRDRLTTHPPVVRHLNDLESRAQSRGISAGEIGRMKESHLTRLATKWGCGERRQLLRLGNETVMAGQIPGGGVGQGQVFDVGGGARVPDAAFAAQHHYQRFVPPLDFYVLRMPSGIAQRCGNSDHRDRGQEEEEEEEAPVRICSRTPHQTERPQAMPASQNEAASLRRRGQQQHEQELLPSDPPPSAVITALAANDLAEHEQHAATTLTAPSTHININEINDPIVPGAPAPASPVPMPSSSRYSRSTLSSSSHCPSAAANDVHNDNDNALECEGAGEGVGSLH
ncbi:hypothetical protein IWX49DRAFT_122825 [Phyllosticta citricarpa]